MMMALLFQSTRPVWGATLRKRREKVSAMISIHAPRVGRDGWIHRLHQAQGYFNPRAPCGARLICKGGLHRQSNFNPRAPCGARRKQIVVTITDDDISIHAPRVGRDPIFTQQIICQKHFNPRAPCGARLWSGFGLTAYEEFQSTRPVWGATDDMATRYNTVAISIHAPRVGRDCYGRNSVFGNRHFNPRAPCGARRTIFLFGGVSFGFQSTRPVWGATGHCK